MISLIMYLLGLGLLGGLLIAMMTTYPDFSMANANKGEVLGDFIGWGLLFLSGCFLSLIFVSMFWHELFASMFWHELWWR